MTDKHNKPAKYLVLIQSTDGMLARLFDAERRHQIDFDASSFEVADMTSGVVPTEGALDPAWGSALEGHSTTERAAALVYVLNP